MPATQLHRIPLPERAAAHDEGLALVYNAAAVLYNGAGRYAQALDAAELACAHPQEPGACTLVLPELIEAASRCGECARAAEALERLTLHARATRTQRALGIEARSRALLSEGPAADALYREAIRRLERSGLPMALARAHLLYGEWLRRERRRADAREQLRTAHRMLAELRLDAFAERAQRELKATGITARKRTPETRDDLTAQERQIAQLAAEGRTNPDIGSTLFLSPRTVEWHLRKVFFKLGIESRWELGKALGSTAA
jgi:ATP/maltotriose-dependent transcriptional regulator MalT